MKKLHIFIILAAALGLVVWFLVWPAIQNILVLRQEQSDWQVKLEEALQFKQKLTSLEVKYETLQDEVSKINDAIPSKSDLPGLLVQLETMASQNGLILNSLNFVFPEGERVAQATATDSEDKNSNSNAPVVPVASAAEQIPPSNVSTLAVSLDLTGDYAALKNFLKAVENNLRLSDVATVAFSQQMSGSVSGQFFGSSKISIGLNVYYKR